MIGDLDSHSESGDTTPRGSSKLMVNRIYIYNNNNNKMMFSTSATFFLSRK